tara:strand:+ start:294 stop:776 length:483 start_codon:yes stop_codon:yes gene_type:complete
MKKTKLTQNLLKSLIKRTLVEAIGPVDPDILIDYDDIAENLDEGNRMLGKTGAYRVREPRSIGPAARAADLGVAAQEPAQTWKDLNPGGKWGLPSNPAPLVDPEGGVATEEEKQEIMSLLSSDRTSPSQKKDLARRIDIHGPTSRALRVFLRDNPDIYPA